MVLWLPSLWSSQIRSLSLQGWWAGFLLSGRVQLPQRHPAENANRKRTWCKNQARSLKEMSGGQGLNLETMSDNRCLKSSGRTKNSSYVCIWLPCKGYTESLSDKNSSLIRTHRLLWRNVKSLWACFADESILELDAGERSSGHHCIIPSASTIRVELPRREATGNKSGRTLELILLGEKPSIGRDHVIVDGKLLLILNFNQRWVF